ncbi:hypothetical protein LY76DRAFT_67140 [Colletotrichum caudatum]|nr:hypothetical protein LY76DRAFT_67140 [Colletotrichum caudatum]
MLHRHKPVIPLPTIDSDTKTRQVGIDCCRGASSRGIEHEKMMPRTRAHRRKLRLVLHPFFSFSPRTGFPETAPRASSPQVSSHSMGPHMCTWCPTRRRSTTLSFIVKSGRARAALVHRRGWGEREGGRGATGHIVDCALPPSLRFSRSWFCRAVETLAPGVLPCLTAAVPLTAALDRTVNAMPMPKRDFLRLRMHKSSLNRDNSKPPIMAGLHNCTKCMSGVGLLSSVCACRYRVAELQRDSRPTNPARKGYKVCPGRRNEGGRRGNGEDA